MKAAPRTLALSLLSLAAGLVLGALLSRSAPRAALLRTAAPAAVDESVPRAFHGRLALFILAGQSNMSGQGDLSNSVPAGDPRAFVFGNDYRWRPAWEPIDDPSGQVDTVSLDRAVGVSPGLAFARSLLERDPRMAVGLIPCAKSGTSIAEWQRDLSDATLYGSCLKRARAASVLGDVRGLLFFQGEADALDPGRYPGLALSPDGWGREFSTFVADLRRDLNRPELPVVFAQIGSTTNRDLYVNWGLVQAQQRAVTLPAVAMIATSDLPLKDEVHFTTEGYRIVGERFAEAAWSLLAGRRDTSRPGAGEPDMALGPHRSP